MRPPTRVLLSVLIALGTAVAVLDARMVAISGVRPVVVPLTTDERMPHMERVEPVKLPTRIVLRVCPPSAELAVIEMDEWPW